MPLERAPTQHEEADRSSRLNTEPFEIAEVANARRATLTHDSLRGDDADARHAQQQLVRRGHDVEWKMLRIGERPRDLRITVERQITVGRVDHLAFAETVVPHEIVGLIQAMLTNCRNGGTCLERRIADRAEGAEVHVMYAAAFIKL